MDNVCRFIGKIIAKSLESEWSTMNLECIKEFRNNYDEVKDLFWHDKTFNVLAGQEIGIYVFSHWH